MNKNQLLEIKETIENAKKDYTEINKNHDSKAWEYNGHIDVLEYWYSELDDIKFDLSFYNKSDKIYNDTVVLMKKISNLLTEMY